MISPRKIALLGGSGFIGSRLTSDLLKSGHNVTIADIEPSFVYPDLRVDADVRNFDKLLPACVECDTIINLAATHRDDVRPVSLYYDTNVIGARMSCQVAEKLGIKHIIFTSSVAVFGHQSGEPNENNPHQPIGPYGETKSQAETVYKDWYAKDPANRTLVIIRPTVIFGPGNRGNVYNLMEQVVKGRFLMVGDGENKKSMAFVGNIAAFINYSLSFGKGLHIYNYIDKPDYSMNALINLIKSRTGVTTSNLHLPKILGLGAGIMFDMLARVTGKKLPISRVRIEKFCATTVFNADKVKASGFVAPTTLEQGLIEMIDAEFNQKPSHQKNDGATKRAA